MTPENLARTAWQSAPSASAALPSLDEVRGRADRFRRMIARRNGIEYAAGAFVIAAFSVIAALMPLPLMRIASAMIVAGAIIMLVQLRRRGSNLEAGAPAGVLPVLAHQRAALVRQREALDDVFAWYIAPFLPGMLLFFAAHVLADPPAIGTEGFYRAVGSFVALVAITVGVWRLNKVAARDLQRQVDEIDALLAD